MVDVDAAGSRAPPGRIGSPVWALGCSMGLGTAAPQRYLQRARKPRLEHLGNFGILVAGAVPWVDSTRWVACGQVDFVEKRN